MPKTPLSALILAAISPAHADVAPEPMNPSTPDGAVVWIAVIAAVAALIVIWRRRR